MTIVSLIFTTLFLSVKSESDKESCMKFIKENLRDIEKAVTPCAFGETISSKCCTAINSMTNLDQDHPLAGCLCLKGSILEVMRYIQNHQVAQSIGFDSQRTSEILMTCKTHTEHTQQCQNSQNPQDL